MVRKVIASFVLALGNIKSHFFRTILSILGVVIGVAALVAILSLIDGMEQYAQEQLTSTTSLKAIMIKPEPMKHVNDVMVRKSNVSYLSYDQFRQLEKSITYKAQSNLFINQAREISFQNDSIQTGATVFGVSGLNEKLNCLHGRKIDSLDLADHRNVVVVNQMFAKAARPKDSLKSLIGRTLIINDKPLEVVGVVENKQGGSAIYFPITILSENELKSLLPTCIIEADKIEDVEKIESHVKSWIESHYKNKDDFSVVTSAFRVKQAAQGFKLFRIIMGLIVGISVLVGGIGVMNVLLISVTERTAEIGVRKAVGANRRDIILQFLSESIAISTFGSMLGLVIGILATMAFVPIIKSLTGVPFYAAYTWNTFLTITIISVLVGVVFGTYPAMRAAKLDPVEAIRKE